PAKTQKKDPEMKLTFINFYTRMFGNKNKNTADFEGNVRVLHLPGDNPRVNINVDAVVGGKMPAGAMYIRCDKLSVWTRPKPSGSKGWQAMYARGRAFVASPEFSGQADSVTYDEEKDTVTFNGGTGGTATLWKVDRP